MMNEILNGLEKFYIYEILLLVAIYALFKTTFPKIIEVWFTKEREFRDKYLHAQYTEEKRIYTELWAIVSKINLDEDEELDTTFQHIKDLVGFKHQHAPFLHISVSKALGNVIEKMENSTITTAEDNDCKNKELHPHRQFEISRKQLINAINKRIFKYDH
ncbi:hypothetical protein [Flocculibacter collagenilyticus]|uniref:hypothetical protein n=1 Tax=Flocculibacter collagenilyticus TaxID=2744479 RepID=UPI0018F34A11|nr:hypothetical protein [Flocculibacter collagenilyticus]